MISLDVLRILHRQTSCDEAAPVPTLRNEFFIPQDIYHEYLERLGRCDGAEAGFLRCITRAEPWDTWYDDVKGLCVR